ncbi:MAG: methyltransferase domain-containing protein [Thermoleophilia bacterium]|nr:methyltransferase domain-containing protein [Thermoleophilia bacterium]
MSGDGRHLPYSGLDPIEEFETGSIYDTLLSAVGKYVRPGGSLLDIGCGRGELMQKAAARGYRVHGVDADEECVRLSSRFGTVLELDAGRISNESFDERFDCVVLSHVIEHIENPRDIIRRAASVSRGLMLISVPNPYYSPYILRSIGRLGVDYVNRLHLYSWDWSHFKTFLELGCGLEIAEFFHDSVALPVPRRARLFLLKKGWLGPVERGFLRALFPRFCSSITAMVRVPAGGPTS